MIIIFSIIVIINKNTQLTDSQHNPHNRFPSNGGSIISITVIIKALRFTGKYHVRVDGKMVGSIEAVILLIVADIAHRSRSAIVDIVYATGIRHKVKLEVEAVICGERSADLV